jgi:hypothetical protein
MVVLSKLCIETDEIMVKLTKIIRKAVACVDFSAPIIQVLNISNIDFA